MQQQNETMPTLDSFTHAQRERLAFIDFNLQYFGQIARADLIAHFKTGLAACTRDLASYRQLSPANLVLVHQTKSYHRTEQFNPLFDHNPEAILTGLCRGFGDGLSNGIRPSDVCIDAVKLVHPDSEVIAAIMRAIKQRYAFSCDYASLSSGLTQRELVPHSIVNNGHRWHVRAFDRKSQQFRDFVCTRLQNVAIIKEPTATVQHLAFDKQWHKIVSITLTPHPALKHKQAIEMDYGMTDGGLVLEVRAALLGYLLRHWNVDCSVGHQAYKKEYQLALANPESLQGVDNLAIAPGYCLESEECLESQECEALEMSGE
ncbi:MAG: hypothetical protein ACI8WB_002409 [Phenylobacterium sp.]|jgi:hypothetical protein